MRLFRTADGRAFHVRAADTENALSPSVEQRVVGTTSVMELAERRCRASTSAASCSDSARYAGECSAGTGKSAHQAETGPPLEPSANVVRGVS